MFLSSTPQVSMCLLNGGVVSWRPCKHTILIRSTMEAKHTMRDIGVVET